MRRCARHLVPNRSTGYSFCRLVGSLTCGIPDVAISWRWRRLGSLQVSRVEAIRGNNSLGDLLRKARAYKFTLPWLTSAVLTDTPTLLMLERKVPLSADRRTEMADHTARYEYLRTDAWARFVDRIRLLVAVSLTVEGLAWHFRRSALACPPHSKRPAKCAEQRRTRRHATCTCTVPASYTSPSRATKLHQLTKRHPSCPFKRSRSP